MRRLPYPLAAVALLGAAPAALAQADDPAVARIKALDDALIATMRTPGGQAARARVIGPVIERSFDLAAMTRLAVGPAWLKASPHEQAALVSGFRAMTIAQFAHNFEGWSGQHFALAGPVETRGADKLVRTTLVSPNGGSEAIAYRLRDANPGAPAGASDWRIIDVYYRNAISQLATRRADFAAVLAKGGAAALVGHLNALAADPR